MADRATETMEAPPQPAGWVTDLESLYREHHKLVLRAAFRVTGSMEDAEDVAQTVFVRLAHRPPSAEVENVQSYLYRSAVNAALDLVRQRQQAKSTSLDDPEAPVRSLFLVNASEGESAEVRRWLREALGRLHPRSAEMFTLRYFEGHGNREIGKMMGTSPAVVAVMLHRIRRQLQKDFRTQMRGSR